MLALACGAALAALSRGAVSVARDARVVMVARSTWGMGVAATGGTRGGGSAERLPGDLRDQADQSAQLVRLRQDAERDQAAAEAANRHAQTAAQRLTDAESRWAAQATSR